MDCNLLAKLAARRRFGMRPGLNSMRTLLDRLGNPQNSLRCVHIAGTNGKGAVAAMIDSVLRASGCATARYTSPHLVKLNERFFLDGAPAGDDALASAAAAVFPAVEAMERETGDEITFFECLTAVAFVLFRDWTHAQNRPAAAILECGLGGRLDATNVASAPLVSVITRIGLDHCAVLGNTFRAIAREKAGIVKPGRPVVCGAMPPEALREIEAAAGVCGSPAVSAPFAAPVRIVSAGLAGQTLEFPFAGGERRTASLPLAGGFQAENASTAIAALEILRNEGFPVTSESLAEGLSRVVWPARFQYIPGNPPVVVDGAHNPDAAAALRDAVLSGGLPRPVCLTAGFCADKDVDANLAAMAEFADCGFAAPVDNPRGMQPGETARKMKAAGIADAAAFETLADAIAAARARAIAAAGSVVICGSLYLAGEALQLLDAFPWQSGAREPGESSLAAPA